MQSAVELSHRRYVFITKLVQRFPEAVPPVKRIDREVAISNLPSALGVLILIYLENAALPSAEKDNVLL